MNFAASNLALLLNEFTELLRHEVFSVSGSTVYGNNETYPNEQSDLDLLALSSSSIERSLSNVCDTNPLKYLTEGMDVVTLSVEKSAPVHIHVMDCATYDFLCSGLQRRLICYRNLHGRGKRIKSTFPYYVSGTVSDMWLSAEIKTHEGGHQITLPSPTLEIPSNWHINSFQDHILTQSEVRDSSNYLYYGRKRLATIVANACRADGTEALNIHRGRSERWSSSFIEEMRNRYVQ